MIPPLEALPIDPSLPAVVAALKSSSGLVICAPPGAGKTTRVPRALYETGFAEKGEIIILEPRRLAARVAAARVATELGERLGETVGFSIRFDTVAGPKTRIRFLTEGILSRRIVQDPQLEGVSAVLLDEFHERHLAGDLALAFLRRLQMKTRPDLKILVMSATLDAAPVAEYLGAVPVLTTGGSRFKLTVEYETQERDQPLHERVLGALSRLLKQPLEGDILVFLPGAGEIRLAAESLRPLSAKLGLLVLPLHGDLPAAAQARVLQPAERRKVILATNVAETSVTIPGIVAVIDSGLARVAGHSSWSGLPVLSVMKVSRAAALQRAGRAGRTRDGKVLCLYTRRDFESRPEHEVPEIRRADLAEMTLILHGAGMNDIRGLSWFEPPPEAALLAAESLLAQLGALQDDGTLSETGRQMLRFPLHPRLSRLVVEGEKLGVMEQSCLLAALLSERDIRLDARSDFGGLRPQAARAAGTSDPLELLDRFLEAEAARFEQERVRSLGLDPSAVEAVERARRQYCRAAGRARSAQVAENAELALRIATLAAFPDRVARRRAVGSRDVLLATGGSGRLAETSVVQLAPLIIAVDAETRTGRKGTRASPAVLIRLASAIEPEWLAAYFPQKIGRRVSLLWNESAGRVDEANQTIYQDLVLEEILRPAPASEEASRILLDQALARGLTSFGDGDRVASQQARIAILAQQHPEAGFRELTDAEIAAACAGCCAGRRSLTELAQVSLYDTLLARLTPQQRDLLQSETPERVNLRSGRRVPVHYQKDRPPWIEALLQDFLGTKATPTICSGRIPLTMHLLAPNRRPLQVTQDLAGFWERHYPALRQQLQHRYPKHAWPEDPV